MRLLQVLAAVLAGAMLSTGVACKKSGPRAPTTFTIKGAQEVITALDRQDFENAVAALPGVKSELPDDKAAKEWDEYRALIWKVREALAQGIGTNSEAAVKANEMFRIIQTGR